jgi:hypothetical protein
VTEFVAPPLRIPPDAIFYRCECGAPIWEHGRYGKDGNQIWAGSSSTGCEKFRASDGSPWPNNHQGATLDDPQDLDLDSVHWIDGQVVLSHEREPDVGGAP